MTLEEPKRLTPLPEVLRELYLKSGNQCAFPGCNHLVINQEGVFVAQICHIEAAMPGGPRFNLNQTNEERRKFDNLLLLCHQHHKVTDDEIKYSVERLKEIKKIHELKFSNIIDDIRNSIIDKTTLDDLQSAVNLKRIHDICSWDLTREQLAETINEFKIANEIKTIYNFVDTDRFNGEVTDCNVKQFAPNGEKILIHTSNFRPVKRLTKTIEIFAKVRKHIPAKLLLVGEGPDRQASHEKSIELGVHDDVIYLGLQHYIENLLGCADIFLIPSGEESFGLAALEAMACKTPVIGSEIGGIPEVVDHGINGFLHPLDDVDAMAESALKLLQNEEKLKAFKEKIA